jgi:hypothetical protein
VSPWVMGRPHGRPTLPLVVGPASIGVALMTTAPGRSRRVGAGSSGRSGTQGTTCSVEGGARR